MNELYDGMNGQDGMSLLLLFQRRRELLVEGTKAGEGELHLHLQAASEVGGE